MNKEKILYEEISCCHELPAHSDFYYTGKGKLLFKDQMWLSGGSKNAKQHFPITWLKKVSPPMKPQDKVDKKRLFELIDDLGKDLRAKAVLKDAIEDLISTVAVTDKELLEACKDALQMVVNMKDEVVYIKVPVDEWSVPDGWTNPDPEDPDYIREEFFAIGNHSTITTVWSESHLQGITHLLVEVPLSELIKKNLPTDEEIDRYIESRQCPSGWDRITGKYMAQWMRDKIHGK